MADSNLITHADRPGRRAYLNSPELKVAFLAEIQKHEAADAIVKGSYCEFDVGDTFRGCAIGCSLHSLNVLQGKVGVEATSHTSTHERYEAELGLPTWLAYLEDNIFENLPSELAMTWPRRFAEAVPVGAAVDDQVLARILCWVLTDTEFGVRYATDREDVRGWIDTVSTYIDADARGVVTADQREAAARDARAAWAAWDAWDAWGARAAWAARAAWDAWAAWAARDARAAWDAWAAWDARDAQTNSSRAKADAFFPALSEFVLGLLRALPGDGGQTAERAEAKVTASRVNGAKGGRPRKVAA